MTEAIIETRNLVKRFKGAVVALAGIDFRVEPGETYGLLGPNGAGKTTLLRILLGLLRPSSGSAQVFGKEPGNPASLRKLGAMGELGFYPFLSGRDNLHALARRSGIRDSRVDQVIATVALEVRARDPFSTYSLGMKQRLGVAAALMKEPALLILDEPSNGLDPIGQVDMRQLLGQLHEAGTTILLCTHDLDDVEILADRIGILGGGRILAEGSPTCIRGPDRAWVVADPIGTAALLAQELRGVRSVKVDGARLCLDLADYGPDSIFDLSRALTSCSVRLGHINVEPQSLTEVFFDLTRKRTGGADSIAPQQVGRMRGTQNWEMP